jgi:phosphatidylserine/phosphatidylglycerophosphate/cardiolipin synthase-like enzyme
MPVGGARARLGAEAAAEIRNGYNEHNRQYELNKRLARFRREVESIPQSLASAEQRGDAQEVRALRRQLAHREAVLDVAMYDFDRASVRDALLAAHARGVTVRVVADGEDAAAPGYAPFYSSLLMGGITVITDTTSSLMHNTFAVFDGQITRTGSANFTNSGFTLNAENALVITDTVVARIYATEFAEMFAGRFSTDKAHFPYHVVTVGGSQLEIAFAPNGDVESRIITALSSANVLIQAAMFTFVL